MENNITTPTPEPINPNAEIAAAFDALARFFYDHPEVKAPYSPDIHVFLDTAEAMSAFVSGNPDFTTSTDSTWFEAKKSFGPITLVYCIKQEIVGAYEDREVIVTKPVWVPMHEIFAVKE